MKICPLIEHMYCWYTNREIRFCIFVVQKMNKNIKNSSLASYLHDLGLNHEETKVFVTLVDYGQLTILELARKAEINRTRVYRLLEDLKERGFIKEIIDEHRRLIQAADLHTLEFKIYEKEAQAKRLRELFPVVASLMHSHSTQPGTKVLFYRGAAGIRQMVWNALRAQGEVVGYSYRTIYDIVGTKFADEWYEEWRERNLKMRDLFSDAYLKSKPKEKITFDGAHFKSRYIPSSILDINHQMDIYNDVVGIYNWHEGEIFGVEIYNQKVAAMHKQLFEIVWKLGKTKLP